MLVYYMGCYEGRGGHYLISPGGRQVDRLMTNLFPCPWETLDGGFTPSGDKEGVVKITHKDDWTILSFLDRSIDTRRGSHSTFLMEGIHNESKAIEIAKRYYPEIFSRYKFQVGSQGPNTTI